MAGQPVYFETLTDVSSARACQDLCKNNDNCRYFLYDEWQERRICKLMARRVTYLERPGGYNEGWDPDAKADLEMSRGKIFGPKVCTTGKIESGISSMSSLITYKY